MVVLSYPEWGRLEISDQPIPQLAPREVLVKVAACGICGSELETFASKSPRRTPPLVMGHEFCGVIEKIGTEVSDVRAGQRVVCNALVPCGDCTRCQRGDTHLCKYRQIFGMHRMGAFAEYVNVPAHCLIPWPEDLAAESACLAEPLANGVHVVNLTQHLRATTVLVIGAGPIGLMCQQALQTMRGAEVIVADLSEDRLKVAQRLGAIRVINAGKEDLVELSKAMTDEEGVDLAVEAVGQPETKRESIEAIRAGGAAVWIGLHGDEMTFDSHDITLAERRVIGSYAAKLSELQIAVELMVDGKVDVSSWVQCFSLDNAVTAFERMLAAKGNDIKAVIVP